MTTRTLPVTRLRRPAMAIPVLVALALSGCGSTALRGGAQAAGGNGLAASQGTTGADQLTQPGQSSTGGTTGQLLGGSTGSTGSSGATTGGTSGASSGLTGSSGATSGVTTHVAKTIRVGFDGADVTAIYAAFGKQNDAPSDPWASTKAMIKYVNDHGGIGGRKIVPVFHLANSAGDASTEGQKACQAFTQDNKVDVVMDGLGSPVVAACLKTKGIADFSNTNWLSDGVDLSQYPNWILPTGMRVDRQIQGLLQSSASRGVLKRGDKIGVMVEDCPYGHRTYDNVVVPFAKQLGATVTQSSIKCLTNLVEDLGPVTSDVQRAALAFSTAGVTRVMAVDTAEAFVIANFTSNASQQHYFPKYLVTSNAYPWGNSQSDATIKLSPDALPNITGVGYMPLLDIGANFSPEPAQKAAEATCTKADPTQLGASSDNTSQKYFKRSIFFSGCDTFFLMKAIIEAANMRLDYPDLRTAYYALKQRGQVSAELNSGRIGGPASSTDGVGFMQPFSYNTTRKTFLYDGSSFPVP